MVKVSPKHRRVYAALRHDILIGKYNSTDKFPSEGMLIRRFGVSRITVRQAMTDLKNDGFLEARSGSGTYLSSLARHATGMLGLVIPDYSSNKFFEKLGDELVSAGKEAGYTMLLGALPGNTPAERAYEAISLAREYARRKVAGVIIEPVELMPDSADLTREIINEFEALKIPVLLIDRDITPFGQSKHDLVGIDNVTAGFTLCKHLISSGVRKIVFLMPPHSASTNFQRMLGVAGAVIQAGLSWSSKNILYIDPTDKKNLAKIKKMGSVATTIICHNDQTAELIPQSINIAGFDGLNLNKQHHFPSMCQPITQLAKTAIDTLLNRIKNPKLPPRKILLNTELVV